MERHGAEINLRAIREGENINKTQEVIIHFNNHYKYIFDHNKEW